MGRPDQEGLAAMCFVVIIDPLMAGDLLRKFDSDSR